MGCVGGRVERKLIEYIVLEIFRNTSSQKEGKVFIYMFPNWCLLSCWYHYLSHISCKLNFECSSVNMTSKISHDSAYIFVHIPGIHSYTYNNY